MKKIVNTHKGFTLAEILIALMILGVIASLTIPSLIQNTHKKEEVVKIKKGLSVINQALSMEYALTGEELSSGDTPSVLSEILKKRLSITSEKEDADDFYFMTQDGLGYSIGTYYGSFDEEEGLSTSNYTHSLQLFTKQYNTIDELQDDISTICDQEWLNMTYGSDYKLSGCYKFYCAGHRCIPSEDTADVMNASDPTKNE